MVCFPCVNLTAAEAETSGCGRKPSDIGDVLMERIKTIETRNLCESAKNGGCGECQTSCQSACKTSCGVANQQCEKAKN